MLPYVFGFIVYFHVQALSSVAECNSFFNDEKGRHKRKSIIYFIFFWGGDEQLTVGFVVTVGM